MGGMGTTEDVGWSEVEWVMQGMPEVDWAMQRMPEVEWATVGGRRGQWHARLDCGTSEGAAGCRRKSWDAGGDCGDCWRGHGLLEDVRTTTRCQRRTECWRGLQDARGRQRVTPEEGGMSEDDLVTTGCRRRRRHWANDKGEEGCLGDSTTQSRAGIIKKSRVSEKWADGPG